MAEEKAPDPARSYERAKPEAESGMGRLDNNDDATPTPRRDKVYKAVKQRQDARQVNAEDDDAVGRADVPPGDEPDHSMLEEEPLGWDQAPTDIHDPRRQRQPRKQGKGGTP